MKEFKVGVICYSELIEDKKKFIQVESKEGYQLEIKFVKEKITHEDKDGIGGEIRFIEEGFIIVVDKNNHKYKAEYIISGDFKHSMAWDYPTLDFKLIK